MVLVVLDHHILELVVVNLGDCPDHLLNFGLIHQTWLDVRGFVSVGDPPLIVKVESLLNPLLLLILQLLSQYLNELSVADHASLAHLHGALAKELVDYVLFY